MEYAFLRHYQRISVSVTGDGGGECEAQTYVTSFPTSDLVPSTEYKSKIVEAAVRHRFPSAYIEEIKNHPSKDTFDLDPGFSLLFPSRRRPLEKLLRGVYLAHDRVREVLSEKLRF